MKVKHIGGDGDLQEFNEEFPKHGLAVVGFFAAWCGHCKTFKPEWEKFTKQAGNSPMEGLVATIPEEHMKDAKCDRSNFQGFPTVRIFRKKGFQDYAGKREAGALMDHIKTLVSQHGGALTDAEVAAVPAVGGVGEVITPSDTSTGKWTKEEFLSRKGEPLMVRIHWLEADEAKLMTPLDVRDDGEGGWFIEFGMGKKENNTWARTSLYRPHNIKSFRAAAARGGKKVRKRRRSTRRKVRRRTRRRRTRRRRKRRRRIRRRRTRRHRTRRRKRRK